MNLLERERRDPNWRKRELDKLTIPLRMKANVDAELVCASYRMECQEVLDTHSAEHNEGFIAGWDRHNDFNAELSEMGKNFENNLHNIYSASQITL